MMYSPEVKLRVRADSPSSISISSRSSSESNSQPGTPVASSPSSLFESLDFDKQIKQIDHDAKGGVSVLRAFFWLVAVSSGGFLIGRCASSSLAASPILQFHEARVNFAQSQQAASRVQENPIRNDSLPSMTYFWNRDDRRIPRAFRPAQQSAEDEELARRKRFAEFAIHPVLLTVRPVPTSIAIAVDQHENPMTNTVAGTELAEDLLSEILVYKSIERVTVVFVNGRDNSEHGASLPECQRSLTDILASTGRKGIDIECSYVNTISGKSNLANRHHDVSVVLSNHTEEPLVKGGNNSKWEEDLYATTDSIAVKRVGRTYPLDHPSRASKGKKQKQKNQHKNKNIDRIEHFFVPDLRKNPTADSFLKVTDYDVFDERGIATNFAVAFRSIKNGEEQWRLPESNYQVAMHQRWASSSLETIQFFDAADMLRIQFPSRHSAVSSCDQYGHLITDDDYDLLCDQGLDTSMPNVPSKNFYVSKSTVNENAGRGVFSSVELELNSYLMAETFAHDVIFSFQGFKIVEKMVGNFCLPKNDFRLGNFLCIVGIYIDAYAYNGIPGGMPVNSGKNTFINHGCHGTANIADEFFEIEETEFTMFKEGEDPDPETFVIPEEFLFPQFYNPNFDRNGHVNRYDSTESASIPAHTEILDNYVAFGGVKYFLTQAMVLKEQCSGTAGTVLSYEDVYRGGHKYDMFGSKYVMDADEHAQRRFASHRAKASDSATTTTRNDEL